MSNQVFVCKSEPNAGAGTFENAEYADGAFRLAQYAGCYMLSGSYTTPEIPAPAFRSLLGSWNAATPPDTSVGLEVRVGAGERWSEWMSFGTWSTFRRRESLPQQGCETDFAMLSGDIVHVNAPAGADRFQLRICLATDDIYSTPFVHLFSASVDPINTERTSGDALYHRCVPVPAYAQMNRDPRICGELCSAVTITMLMNRWGEDLIPEEVAHAQYDFAAGYHNRCFIPAVAGSFGYESYCVFADIAALKKEIKAGFACGVRLSCADTPETSAETGLPLLEGSIDCADGRFVVVRGFETDADGTEYVIVNDPHCSDDSEAERRYRLDQFDEAWHGEACLVHGKVQAHVVAPPERVAAELRHTELPGEYALYLRGERLSLPVDLCEKDGRCTGTVCYTIRDEHAYATAAHKRFYYTDVSESGNVLLDTETLPSGTRITVYLIGESCRTAVAELTV